EKRAAASERFDILYEEGFCRKAETILRKALAISSNDLWKRKSEEEIWTHALLRAKRVVIMLHTSGKLEHLMRLRNELVEVFLDRVPEDSRTNPIVVRSCFRSVLTKKVELECVCA